MKFKNREQLLMVIAGGAVALYVLVNFISSPLVDVWKARQAQVKELRERVDTGNRMIKYAKDTRDNWDAMHGIRVPSESDNLLRTVQHSVLHLKNKKVMMMLEENRRLIREYQQNGNDVMPLLENHIRLEQIKAQISKLLGIDILR